MGDAESGSSGIDGSPLADAERSRKAAASSTVEDSGAEPTAVADASDAFQALGNETRLEILRALLTDGDDGHPTATTLPFSELFEATGLDTSAQFAYHLRQLTGTYLQETDEGYTFTYAGLKVARALLAGTYTDRVDVASIPLEEPCPFCGQRALAADAEDNVFAVACRECRQPVLSLPFPPAGAASHAGDDLPAAFDTHHRHRIAMLRDGVCPECAGTTDTSAESARDPAEGDAGDAVTRDTTTEGEGRTDTDRPATTTPVRARFDCRQCGYRLRCPVTLAVLEHPSVIAFYHDHGESIRERPLWNVGEEWREALLSTDPWCLRVSTRVGGERLSLYVDRTLAVREQRREGVSAS